MHSNDFPSETGGRHRNARAECIDSDCASEGQRWRQFKSPLTAGSATTFSSTGPDDPSWDSFLLATNSGQFQQSSAWARVKSANGWHAYRCILADDRNEIVAGFQILWKRSRGVRIGYVSKGPVISIAGDRFRAILPDLLKEATRNLRLQAVIVQPPDDEVAFESTLRARGFSTDHLMDVISATIVQNLARPMEQIVNDFSRNVARENRKAMREGVTVRRGTPREAATFFELMRATCERQQTKPNPGSPLDVEALLEAFAQLGSTRAEAFLLFAEYRQQAVAGLLSIRFGDRLTLWKKGWSGDTGSLQPNRLLDVEAMRIGLQHNCCTCDWASLDRVLAAHILAGEPHQSAKASGVDRYKMLFGGTPRLIPAAAFWCPNPVLHKLYGALGHFRQRVLRPMGRASTRHRKS